MATAAAQAPQQPVPPPLPLTQLDASGPAADLDARSFSLTFAQPVPIQDLLLLLVRGTDLSLIPSPEIDGTFIGELKNVTVRQALDSILPPLGLDYTVDGGFIRVFTRARDTRIFDLNHIVAVRSSSATIGRRAADPNALSSVAVSTVTNVDLFADVTNGIGTLLSEDGAFNLDRKAGFLQVTDYPERLDRVGQYIDTIAIRLQRQVELDARIVEVLLDEEHASGVDWGQIAAGMGSGAAPAALQRFPTGVRVTDLSRLLALLADQGSVATIQNAKLTTLNNEPAILRSEALTLSVTPWIGADGTVTLSLTPMLNTPALAESDTLARVADGETLVVSGFTHQRDVRERTGGGWFGRGTTVVERRVELLILLTPRVL
jgi:MSHA biogenesis protein MshL